MMESVGGYAHQLRDTHPPLAPPPGYMMLTPPFGCGPGGRSLETQAAVSWRDGGTPEQEELEVDHAGVIILNAFSSY